NAIDNNGFFAPIVQPGANPAKGWTLLLLPCSAIAEIGRRVSLLFRSSSNAAVTASSLVRFALLVCTAACCGVAPAKQRHQLMFSGAGFSAALRPRLAQPMGAEIFEPGLAAAVLEPIAKAFGRVRLSIRRHQIHQVSPVGVASMLWR